MKTNEEWKWFDMQGLELVASALPLEDSSFKSDNPSIPTTLTTTTTTATSLTPQDSEQQEERERDLRVGMEGSERGGSGEKPSSPPPTVGFGELFRFADGLDYVLMGIGSLGAFIHGFSLPLFLRFFADLVNSFGSYAHDVDKMTQEVLKVP